MSRPSITDTWVCGDRRRFWIRKKGAKLVSDTSFERLRKLANACDAKWELLGRSAYRRIFWAKVLHVLAGVLALISGASVISLIAAVSDELGVKIFAAAIAFASGLTTLVISSYFDQKETVNILEGASHFLALRDEANVTITRPNLTPAQAYETLDKLRREYDDYTAQYAQWTRWGKDYERKKTDIEAWTRGEPDEQLAQTAASSASIKGELLDAYKS
jgi:hypothetical protein